MQKVMDNPAASTFVLYDDDSVVVTFEDASVVSLSPCGTDVRLCLQCPRNTSLHPITQPPSTIQKRTQYVLSHEKWRVKEALKFRNRFAERPYLCPVLLEEQKTMYFYADVSTVKWPEKTSSANLTKHTDGSIKLTSLDECASLTLSANRQEFSAEFLCKFNSSVTSDQQHSSLTDNDHTYGQPCRSRTDFPREHPHSSNTRSYIFRDVSCKLNFSSNFSTDNITDFQCPHPQSDTGTDLVCPQHFSYVWQIQNHSVMNCPQIWRYPLSLILKSDILSFQLNNTSQNRQAENVVSSCKDPSERKLVEPPKQISFALPLALPLCCPRSYLHKVKRGRKSYQYNTEQYQDESEEEWMGRQRMKVLFKGGVIYRLYWHPEPFVEVYSGDGTLIRSRPKSSSFFSHFIPQPELGIVEEKILSVHHLTTRLLQNRIPYLPALLQRAYRLLYHMTSMVGSNVLEDDTTCWKEVDYKLTNQIVGTTLVLKENIKEGVGKLSALSDGRTRVVFVDRTTLEFYPSAVNDEKAFMVEAYITLPNSCQVAINLLNPGREFEWYAQIALDWMQHMESEKQMTPNIQCVGSSTASEELSGIRNFLCNTDDKHISSVSDVTRTLSRTSKVIGDIQKLLMK